ncbi:MAG: VWA domain-containing protein [Vicinamibacterales bacterium]
MFRIPLILPAVFATIAVALTVPQPTLDASTSAASAARQAGGRERVLYASVVDKNGEPVTGLGADDFIVREDNVRREVLRVSPAVEPMALAILVDNSAAAEDDIRNIREGLTTFVQQMRTGHDIAIIGLADRPTILQDYTRNGELLQAAIGRLFAQPGSGMMLLDTIVEVSRGLSKRDEPRANIVAILTDGTEFSTLHYTQVLEPLRGSGAALHALAIGTFASSMRDELRNRAVVLDLGPRRTGGQRQTLLSSMAVPGALERLGRELSNQYKVVYGRPEALIQPETTTVDVTRPGLTARGTPERRKPGA